MVGDLPGPARLRPAAHQNPGPDSDWLLQGGPPGTTPAANTGLAQAIAERSFSCTGAPEDPNAVLLAYSWIDDSATPDWDFLHFQVPEDADLSEARTTLNGLRLASALETALGSSTAAAAEIQLIGHSHGSKVATVAAGALAGAGYPLRQLTILDSPEASGSVQGEGVVADGAANFNWFFLQDLTLNRQTASAPFVDNYISYFDAPYGGITSNGTVTLPADLNQVVDVSLYPDSIDVIDLGDKHSYAAWWYTGSGDPTLNGNQPSGVGQYWSPMLPANGGSSSPVPGLSPYYQQDWSILSHPAEHAVRPRRPVLLAGAELHVRLGGRRDDHPAAGEHHDPAADRQLPGALLRLHGALVRLPVHVLRPRRRA